MKNIGEIYGLITALFWMITSLAFEIASKKFGSLTVNFVRLFLAFILLSIFGYFTRGLFFPTDATLHNWLWLALSGIIGFVIGDFMLFKAFSIMGARVSQVIMALAPPIAALVGWLVLGEKLSLQAIAGMTITISGIMLVVVKKDTEHNKTNSFKFGFPLVGILFAFGGAVGQGVGLVVSKLGMQNYNAFAASQIRVLTGVVGFFFIILFQNKWFMLKQTLPIRKESIALLIGTIFGPFLGVAFSLLTVQHTSSGIAQTLISIVPVIIIPFSHLFFKEKISVKEIIGAFVAFGGISLFFIEL